MLNCIQWRSQSKILGRAKYFDPISEQQYLGHRLSKHKTKIHARNFGGSWPLWSPLATPMTGLSLLTEHFSPAIGVRLIRADPLVSCPRNVTSHCETIDQTKFTSLAMAYSKNRNKFYF